MTTSDFDDRILTAVDHRPWPLPLRPWLMTQSWHHLLFAHWPVSAGELRRFVPDVFPLDLFEGHAWIGVVPFVMTNVGPRGLPSIPGLARFAELNVRTYVRLGDKAGVYFFSLDAASALAVRAARGLLNLPYHLASMTVQTGPDAVDYSSRRRDDASITFEARYGPAGDAGHAAPGTLDHFLTERYCLYHVDRRGRPYRLEIHHRPWPLQPGWADLRENSMLRTIDVTPLRAEPVLHFARRLDVVAWGPTPVESRDPL